MTLLLPYVDPSSRCGWLLAPEPQKAGVTAEGALLLNVRDAARQAERASQLVREWARLWQFNLPTTQDNATLAHVVLDLALTVLAALTDDPTETCRLAQARAGGNFADLPDCCVVISGVVVAAALTELLDGPFERRATHAAAIRSRLVPPLVRLR